MKKLALFAALTAVLFTTPADAQDKDQDEDVVKYFQISLWPSAQVYDKSYSIHGVRLSLLYGVNRDMIGFDFGIANDVGRDMKGVQLG
ncbi:MAG: hypothetical protein KAT30_01300, partial [Candidatus Krumholzibacteria bacterium]|nr:hypothetical protein [Candidatus Krumholzibacteria bacterium]